MNKIVVGALFCACLIAGCSEQKTATADFVFTNSRVYTVDEARPWAEAVAVKGSEIVYVGDRDGVQALVGNDTIVRDVEGQLLLPGFIDSHVHPIAGGAYARALSLDTFGTGASSFSAA